MAMSAMDTGFFVFYTFFVFFSFLSYDSLCVSPNLYACTLHASFQVISPQVFIYIYIFH